MKYDVIIIGAGPAGITAAIYADRAGLKTLVLEKLFVGGQIVNTYEVENYPGFSHILGQDLVLKLGEHVAAFKDIELKREAVIDVYLQGDIKVVKTKKNSYDAKSVIIATGATPRYLNVPGEDIYKSKGVSYCGTCDGALYRKKDVVVVGGGNTAVEDAIFLSRLCNKVYLVHRRDSFRAAKKMVNNMLNIENIEVCYDSIVENIGGNNEKVEHILIKNIKSNEQQKIYAQCIFIAVGQIPNNDLFKGKIKTTEQGYIITDNHMETSEKGVFAAGDGRENVLKQIITAAGEGAVAAYGASVYIATN